MSAIPSNKTFMAMVRSVMTATKLRHEQLRVVRRNIKKPQAGRHHLAEQGRGDLTAVERVPIRIIDDHGHHQLGVGHRRKTYKTAAIAVAIAARGRLARGARLAGYPVALHAGARCGEFRSGDRWKHT